MSMAFQIATVHSYTNTRILGRAHIQIGRMYALGEGVEQDYEEAWFWLVLASAQNPKAALYYTDIIRRDVTDAKKESAERRAAEWRP